MTHYCSPNVPHSMNDRTSEEEEYLLGTHDAEIARLGFQHQVWRAEAAHGWERAGFRRGHRLLDVGCGPGHTTFDMAALVGDSGEVVGVDLSPRFIAHMNAQAAARGVNNVRARVQNVEQLEVDESSFDGAYTRWVLCFVEDPEAVVAGVARALRPGARFVVQDYLNYTGITFAPPSDAFSRGIAAVARSWRGRGGDPDVGTRLAAMMIRRGLEVTSVTPIVRIARPGSALWQWPETFFRGYLPNLVEWGLLAADDAAAFVNEWETRSGDSSAFLLTPPMVEVIGTRK